MTFPVAIAARQDSRFFSEKEIEDTVRGELEGGYVHTRARTTRAPRLEIQTGFTDLTDAEKITLQAFFKSRSTHTAFVYTHPTSGASLTVRFGGAITYKYTGKGGLHFWTVQDVVLKEV